MKYIREASDIHLDWDIGRFRKTRILYPDSPLIRDEMDLLWYPLPKPEDLDTTFVVAGDIWFDRKFVTRRNLDKDSWIMKMSRQFKYVVLVLGNHDYWECHLKDEPKKIKKAIAEQGLTNVFLKMM